MDENPYRAPQEKTTEASPPRGEQRSSAVTNGIVLLLGFVVLQAALGVLAYWLF